MKLTVLMFSLIFCHRIWFEDAIAKIFCPFDVAVIIVIFCCCCCDCYCYIVFWKKAPFPLPTKLPTIAIKVASDVFIPTDTNA